MTSRTRAVKNTTETPAPAKKTTARKTTQAASRPARKRTTARKTAPGAPSLSLVKPPKILPTREQPFMTDTQGYATLAARMVGIRTDRIRDWRDHRDGTATRPLHNGSTLHYDQATRTLTWHAVCPMGAVHQYQLTSHSMACAARLHANGCTRPHADLSKVPPLTPEELEALGLLQTPTWARPDIVGDAITETIPVPLPEQRDRALADTLAHSGTAADETQPMSRDAITEGLAQRTAEQPADTDTPKEHPQP